MIDLRVCSKTPQISVRRALRAPSLFLKSNIVIHNSAHQFVPMKIWKREGFPKKSGSRRAKSKKGDQCFLLGVDLRQPLALPYELHGKRFAETQQCQQVLQLTGNGPKQKESGRQRTDRIRETWPTTPANTWLSHTFVSSMQHKRRFNLSCRSAHNQTTGADQNDS